MAAAVGALVLPAVAGDEVPVPVGNDLTVEKDVVGPVPTGTVFTVELTCMSLDNLGPSAQGVEPIEITFDEHGTGGAKTVAYACDMTTTHPTLATCESPTTPTVSFNDVTGTESVITVTNTFVAATTPPPEPAGEVVVEPAFTG